MVERFNVFFLRSGSRQGCSFSPHFTDRWEVLVMAMKGKEEMFLFSDVTKNS